MQDDVAVWTIAGTRRYIALAECKKFELYPGSSKIGSLDIQNTLTGERIRPLWSSDTVPRIVAGAYYFHKPTHFWFIFARLGAIGRPPQGYFELTRDEAKLLLDANHDVDPSVVTSGPSKNEQAQPVETGSQRVEPAKAETERLAVGPRALGAAYALKSEGKPVSVKAACERAGVDRKNIRERHPKIVRFINALAAADRSPPRMTRDTRTRDVDGIHEDDD